MADFWQDPSVIEACKALLTAVIGWVIGLLQQQRKSGVENWKRDMEAIKMVTFMVQQRACSRSLSKEETRAIAIDRAKALGISNDPLIEMVVDTTMAVWDCERKRKGPCPLREDEDLKAKIDAIDITKEVHPKNSP
ncbi:hypothetical protein GTO89_13230 [Heliobacterium gestii]|uniref:Uncharacterized protein n=1 Tax=Heliomicrobium gestii TaxID=2699 RepID=A0A845LHU4_HELGE|nr:hypothetical protein [Heliomicrobium gestii]MBM7867601.1 hypothetical protein [Heliomicrobium gestii]MZP43995.1 hypothetical protein [Heliomicrobium gestii]